MFLPVDSNQLRSILVSIWVGFFFLRWGLFRFFCLLNLSISMIPRSSGFWTKIHLPSPRLLNKTNCSNFRSLSPFLTNSTSFYPSYFPTQFLPNIQISITTHWIKRFNPIHFHHKIRKTPSQPLWIFFFSSKFKWKSHIYHLFSSLSHYS